MDTTTSAVAAVLIVTAGRWAQKKEISIKIVVGLMVLVISLSVLESANEKLAKQFSVLILVGAVFTYAIPVTKKLGLTK